MHNDKYKNTTFVYINETFYAPVFRNNPNSFRTITDAEIIEFEYGKPVNSVLAYDTPYMLQNPHENYTCGKHFGPHIYLIMSVSKLLYEKPVIHLYKLLQHSEGILRMGVFGFIIRLSDFTYHINPLAVWI